MLNPNLPHALACAGLECDDEATHVSEDGYRLACDRHLRERDYPMELTPEIVRERLADELSERRDAHVRYRCRELIRWIRSHEETR